MLHRSEDFQRQSRGASHSTLRLHPRGQTLPAELLRVDAQSPQNEVLRYAAHFLTRGCVVGIPTDTFYDLVADPFNFAALYLIFPTATCPRQPSRSLPSH